jgi:hypothetical protein
VFLPGHRIMVQIQSSWFPLYDRNPQTFVPNIFNAQPADYKKATQRIYHDSYIELPLVKRHRQVDLRRRRAISNTAGTPSPSMAMLAGSGTGWRLQEAADFPVGISAAMDVEIGLPAFSPAKGGFRAGRGAAMALRKAGFHVLLSEVSNTWL